ncbi:unnamed protein product [Linum trigynum]|uniref:Uncharacterized protein n=1 Tax=Linum trigynum TaxID=586398 RepID=A0AAV2ENR2_9ROSI
MIWSRVLLTARGRSQFPAHQLLRYYLRNSNLREPPHSRLVIDHDPVTSSLCCFCFENVYVSSNNRHWSMDMIINHSIVYMKEAALASCLGVETVLLPGEWRLIDQVANYTTDKLVEMHVCVFSGC